VPPALDTTANPAKTDEPIDRVAVRLDSYELREPCVRPKSGLRPDGKEHFFGDIRGHDRCDIHDIVNVVRKAAARVCWRAVDVRSRMEAAAMRPLCDRTSATS